jgi:uncharacterized membrane protein YeaQ/YmgE (transglycosylase-associated protein family)
MEVNTMRLSLFVLWAIVGWCGTPWPRWWRWPPPPPPLPDPDPWPIYKVIGIVGGIAGGWVFTQVFEPNPSPWNIAINAAASAVGAVLGARLLLDLYGLAKGGAKAPRA